MRTLAAILLSLITFIHSGFAADPAGGAIRFNEDIRPLLNKNCTSCHGGVKQAGDVSFIYRELALGKGKSGKPVIVPGHPEQSEMIRRLTTRDEDDRMPPVDEHPEGLSKGEIRLLSDWIAQGADWDEHWSFIPPQDAPLPKTANKDWPRQSLDHFILARLEAESLSPSQPASPAEWLRRAAFDLTGLPPTLDALRKLKSEAAKDPEAAYARAADDLLASPAFGERWASLWMDLARYADSAGFEKDPQRNTWPYRDWLIRALNADLPFDAFTVKQLAGDLLPEPAPDDLIATAFHRNTMTNTEGGTDDEEYRVAAVLDRVNTTWTVWQGLTFGCVQCHNHPYDPFGQPEYYRFMAFFNSTEDCDLRDEFPTWNVPADPAKFDEALALDREAADALQRSNSAGGDLAEAVTDWTPLLPTKLEPSHGKLALGDDHHIRSSGTIPSKAHYTLTAPATELHALRFHIYPDSKDPKKLPERGSVLSHLILEIQPPDGGKKQEVRFSEVFTDHLAGPFVPTHVLQKGKEGIGGYPKLFGPRWAVLIPAEPVKPPPGSQFVITLHQNHSTVGGQATPLRNFSLAISSDPRWQEHINSPEHLALKTQLTTARKARNAIKGKPLPIMRERPAIAARPTHVFQRGSRLDPGEEQQPGVPSIMPSLPAKTPNRLDMARWLVSPENPLTARVLANRLWAELFGIGLVETQEDFGSTGTPPSHPALLDHLALRLSEEHRWHLKPFLRELVLSATYRQSNRITPAKREHDPRNRLLSRGPATRLTAEMVRDQALAVSGLLSDKRFGPSVMPPQPDGVWQTVYSSTKWETPATGPDRYRRALYTYWRRTSPYPSFLIFDAPSREVCTPRRISTNTPLHALVTLNDPVYLECARAFARRMRDEGGSELREQLAWALTRATQTPARPAHVESLLSLYSDAKLEYENQPEEARALADTPGGAALVLVANTILNLDAATTK